MKKLLLIPFLLFSTLAFASAPNRIYNYISHAVIDPAQNNTNENTLYSYLQNGVDTFAVGSITDIAISASAAISYSKLNLLNSIVNSDINSSAAIAYSKLNLAGGIVNADVNASAAIAYSKLNLSNSIVNADINSSAAITDSKLAQITTASKVSGTAITGLASLPSGAGIIPSANLPTYGMTFISATTISGAATTGSIALTTGKTYFVQFNFINFTGSTSLLLRFNTDSGSTYTYSNLGVQAGSATVLTNRSTSTTSIALTPGSALTQSSTTGINGGFYIQQLGASSQRYRVWGNTISDDNSGNIASGMIAGMWNNAADVTSFALITGAGNMTGTVYLYQVATS